MTIPEQAVDVVQKQRECSHKKLYFGSGGFYVFCADCGGTWVARKIESDEIDYQRSNNIVSTADQRVPPADASLVGVERAALQPLRAREEIAALRELYEWYDRDGSVGAAADVFEKHRALLAP